MGNVLEYHCRDCPLSLNCAGRFSARICRNMLTADQMLRITLSQTVSHHNNVLIQAARTEGELHCQLVVYRNHESDMQTHQAYEFNK